MTPLALIRHGLTDWNEQKRLQGRADRRLSPAGRAEVGGWSVPRAYRGFDWVCSPLTRAVETARLLDIETRIEPALIEMDWGAWEGATIDELRARYGDEVQRRTAQGLDLRPHDGESPREVRARVGAWAATVAASGRPTGAVCHQGIVRAFLSLATGWEMIGEPPHRLDWSRLHLFAVGPDRRVEIRRLDVALDGS